MKVSFLKVLLGIIAFSSSIIAIELIPISKQAYSWNRCFKNTSSWLQDSPNLKGWSKDTQRSVAVAICNGAVHEPKIKS